MLSALTLALGFGGMVTGAPPAVDSLYLDEPAGLIEPVAGPSAEPLFGVPDTRRAHRVPVPEQQRSKKELWRLEKATRPDVHLSDGDLPRVVQPPRPVARRLPVRAAPAQLDPVGARLQPITTLFNIWTKEALPLIPGQRVEDRFHPFLRDHFTNQATQMDTRLIDVLTKVAERFRAARIEVVSGYRSPKYNLMLRKKGHEVARTSQHSEGNAVDFRIRGVPTPTLLRYVRSLRRGGVGFYPHSQFVHSDTGRIRFWKGT